MLPNNNQKNSKMVNSNCSFTPYGKIDEAKQAELESRRRTKKQIIIIVLSSIVLVSVVLATVYSTLASNKNNNGGGANHNNPLSAVCEVTLYPDTCYSTVFPLINSTNLQPHEISKLAILVAVNELSRASNDVLKGVILNSPDNMTVHALENCQQLLNLALDHLNQTLTSTQAGDDLQTWLSSAGTYQQTCIDGLEEINSGLKDIISGFLKNSLESTSNGLAIITWLSKLTGSVKGGRRLMGSTGIEPDWVGPGVRRLLQSDLQRQAGFVVSKDGSGKYKTIGDALKDVPDKSENRSVIYVKRGVYYENVRVEKTKWNVVFVGDGMNLTVVSGRLNFVDGTPTFSTATFAVLGKGFVARDIGFKNTAGAIKHQAVALLSTADQSVFYRCLADAYQDTLYTHSNRQFYQECTIYGTVDFIFGNSAVVFQNCTIMPRLPLQGQQNMVTAQGKFDPNQNTGISIQDSIIQPLGNLSSRDTYLGRPWKNYSTTVYLTNYFGGFINPKGWFPWVGTTAPDTIFYAEYGNFGPGSSTVNRVKWRGVRSNITKKQAMGFTVSSFIGGGKWISTAGIQFKSGI